MASLADDWRVRAAAWVASLGLDPMQIVDDGSLDIRGRAYFYREIVRDKDGRALVARNEGPKTVTRIKTLTPEQVRTAP